MADLWLPARPMDRPATGRIVIFPHAGSGSAAWFRWGEAAPPWMEVRVARLPGRESRLSEPPMTSPAAVLDAATQALGCLRPLPTIAFGHSLGAYLAHGVCDRLPGQFSGLIVSGAKTPGPRRGARLSQLSDEALADAAHRKWDAIPDVIRQSAQLRALFLPALRGDLALAEQWPSAREARLDLPLVVVAGHDDPDIGAEEIEGWRSMTRGSTALIAHAGGHMEVLAEPVLARRVIGAAIELLLA